MRTKAAHHRKSYRTPKREIMDVDTNLSGKTMETSVVMPMREKGIGKSPDRNSRFRLK